MSSPDELAPAPARPAEQGGRGARVVWFAFAPVIGVAVPLLVWQLYVRWNDIRPNVLPAPWAVIGDIWGDPGFYASNAWITVREATIGLLIGGAIALVVATVLAHSRWLERASQPWIVLFQVTPIIAYAPAIVIWLSFGFRTIVVLTAISSFVPILVNAVTGLRSVDSNQLELARSVDANRHEIMLHLRIPSALPSLFTALRISVGLALIGAVIGEWFAGVNKGLGYAIKVAQSRNLPLQLWASTFTLAVVGSLAVILLTIAERFILHWHASQRH